MVYRGDRRRLAREKKKKEEEEGERVKTFCMQGQHKLLSRYGRYAGQTQHTPIRKQGPKTLGAAAVSMHSGCAGAEQLDVSRGWSFLLVCHYAYLYAYSAGQVGQGGQEERKNSIQPARDTWSTGRDLTSYPC